LLNRDAVPVDVAFGPPVQCVDHAHLKHWLVVSLYITFEYDWL